MVASGEQTMDVWKKIKPLAYQAADIAVAIAQAPETEIKDLIAGYTLINNGYGDIPTIITPVVSVTKSTIESTVIDGGFYTSEQVFQN